MKIIQGAIRAGHQIHLEDDSLAHDESGGFCCTHTLSDEKKEMICAALSRAQDELQDAIFGVQGSTCDLIEVCCSPESQKVG